MVNPVALTWCHNRSIVDDLEVIPHALLGVAIRMGGKKGEEHGQNSEEYHLMTRPSLTHCSVLGWKEQDGEGQRWCQWPHHFKGQGRGCGQSLSGR